MRKFSIFFLLIPLLTSCPQNQNSDPQFPPLPKPEKNRAPEPMIAFAPKSYICYRANAPLTIDGKLDETAWQAAPFTDRFQDIVGPSKPEPRHDTRMKMLWDETYFYFAAVLDEPHVWAKLKKRDSIIFFDNDFEIFIDPDGDTYNYYELEVNAFATEWDLFIAQPYRDGGPAIHAWDITGLKTAVHVDGTLNDPSDTDKGWSVEIAIPWEMLKEAAPDQRGPEAGEYWRVNFSRVQWQTEVVNGGYEKIKDSSTGKPLPEDNWVWSPQGLVNMHYPEMWGFVHFAGKAPGGEEIKFEIPAFEMTKNALRQVYYRQHAYFFENGLFAKGVETLDLAKPEGGTHSWPPTIQTTRSQFEAMLLSADQKTIWHIDQDGWTWKTELD